MNMLISSSAFPSARTERLLQSLRRFYPDLEHITVHHVYLCDSDDAQSSQLWINPSWVDSLASLLSISPANRDTPFTLNIPKTGSLVLVVPRLGTISPWSTKATDILHRCGFTAIKRIERGTAYVLLNHIWHDEAKSCIHDRMTESVLSDITEAMALFRHDEPQPMRPIPVLSIGRVALEHANRKWGLSLHDSEIDYVLRCYNALGRDPSDIELMMFAQIHSEHCRHKIFRSPWMLDGEPQNRSLMEMIEHTYHSHPENVLSAYRDNAAVIAGYRAKRFFPCGAERVYRHQDEEIHLLLKVETHNHPTGISPYPGAATGVGGEIRDEGATGRGGKTKAGLVGFAVSNLFLPNFPLPWEESWESRMRQSPRMASAFEIMRDAPLGAANYHNEFGRPVLTGFFRSFSLQLGDRNDPDIRGFHKPIMIAGGWGQIRPMHVTKKPIPDGACVVVLGGPAMLIGLGGGSASSRTTGDSSAHLDFASVQRDNAEMQRRCQEVIDHCWSLGHDNPILAIHDVGAGGLANAIPELLHDSGKGGALELRQIPNDEPAMNPLELWCNESQERYVLALSPGDLPKFETICQRERCPFAVLGVATSRPILQVFDRHFANVPVDLPMSVLFDTPPLPSRVARSVPRNTVPFDLSAISLEDAAFRVLHHPTVAAKTFLITIADRSITGLVVRDQMVGPWQVPVADVAVTASSWTAITGEAVAMGERSPVALLSPAAAGRLAVAETITNLAAAPIRRLSDIKLSANWMAAVTYPGEEAALYEAVYTVAMELCPALQLAIPVGKDSLSMQAVWQENGCTQTVAAPLSLVVSGLAPVPDCRRTLTPQLRTDQGPTWLVLLDLGRKQSRMGGSCLAQVYGQLGQEPPDLDAPELLADFFAGVQSLSARQKILAVHDRSDGGLWACLCEMAFAGHTGLSVSLDPLGHDPLAILFAEELGAVLQIKQTDWPEVQATFANTSLANHIHVVGSLSSDFAIEVWWQDARLLRHSVKTCYQAWEHVSHSLRLYRDDPNCVWSEYLSRGNPDDPGLHIAPSFDPREDVTAPFVHTGIRPSIAILREQGVNGHNEMAAAFDLAGFRTVDVHTTDILERRVSLQSFQGIAVCGGFSYGDVLGAGVGWAQSILRHPVALDEFSQFFARTDTFGLGVCNGCQMMSVLKPIIPGAAHWPNFWPNQSERFESRWCMVEVLPSPSIFLQGMAGSRLPVVVAHAEGRVRWSGSIEPDQATFLNTVCLRYVDNLGQVTTHYPHNPNGSIQGMTGFCNQDGRFTILMPHPERVFRSIQHTWQLADDGEYSPWMRMFRNARAWIG